MNQKKHLFIFIIMVPILGIAIARLSNRLRSPIGFNYTNVPFEAINQATDPHGIPTMYENPQTAIASIANSNHAKQLDGMITTRIREELADLDYQSQSVLVLFAGRHGFLHPGVDIQQISYQDNQIWIQADNLFKGGSKKMAISSPYQVVSIEKPVDWQSDFPTTIVVSIEGNIVISQTTIISGYTFLQGEQLINPE